MQLPRKQIAAHQRHADDSLLVRPHNRSVHAELKLRGLHLAVLTELAQLCSLEPEEARDMMHTRRYVAEMTTERGRVGPPG